MFLIHNALGEDAKIFDEDEEFPHQASLGSKINSNPQEKRRSKYHYKNQKSLLIYKISILKLLKKSVNYLHVSKLQKLSSI